MASSTHDGFLHISIQTPLTKTFNYDHYYLFDYCHRFHSKALCPVLITMLLFSHLLEPALQQKSWKGPKSS